MPFSARCWHAVGVSDDTRSTILDAAEEAFKLEPFAQVSVAAIAAWAHVSVGGIYRHFGDKTGLRAAVIERLTTRGIELYLRPTLAPEVGSPGERLIELARAYVRGVEEREAEYALIHGAMHDRRESDYSQRFTDAARTAVSGFVQEIVGTVREAQATGEIDEGNAARTVVVAWASVHGICNLALRFPGPIRGALGPGGLESVAEEVVRRAVTVRATATDR